MKYQGKTYSCGAASVRNALRAFGIKVTEQEIRNISGTTPEDGTVPSGLIKAIHKFKLSALEIRSNDFDLSTKILHDKLRRGFVVILAVECWEHYVLCIGTLGPSGVAIVDPANFKVNKNENGIHVWNPETLKAKWYNNRKGHKSDHKIYGIVVGRLLTDDD